MGLMDWFVPDPPIACASCGKTVKVWQGKEGPQMMAVWKQGSAHPVEQRVDEEIRWSKTELERFSLPERFHITGHCEEDHVTHVACECSDGIWIRSSVDPDPAATRRIWRREEIARRGY